jgi:arabinose-5-phosphate isomerase
MTLTEQNLTEQKQQSTQQQTADDTLINAGKRTVTMELAAIEKLTHRIDQHFIQACQLMLKCKGRVIVTGMGKSGHIANKIAATLASTGTPAFFVHPAEASHGDLGMITREDVVIAISSSGSSTEIVTLLPLLKRMAIPLISMTGQENSPLAQQSEVNLDISVESEACPLDLAPTSSTTVTLVMGDALAVALLEARGFTAEDFAFSHPGGALGRRLLLKVSDIMHADQTLPMVKDNASLKDALMEMSEKGLGMTTVVNAAGKLRGVFTDGDLRRTLDRQIDINKALIKDVMSANPACINPDMLAAEALNIMEKKSITALIVADKESSPLGVLHMHDLLKAGII